MGDNWPEAWPNVVPFVDEVHTFDPDGDVLLLLQKTIVIKASTVPKTPPDDEGSQESESADGENVILRATSPLVPPVDEDTLEVQQLIRAREYLLSDDTAPDEMMYVYLRVSSRHLILASPVFKAMLGSNTFAEGNILRSQGSLTLELPDDPEALIILMYIVHGMTRRVPRNTTLDTLAKLAVLVDYYQLHDVVELFSDTWIANLKQHAFPKSYNPEIVPWLFISLVFQKRDIFKTMTQILACESDDRSFDDVEHEKYPRLHQILSRIQEHRNNAIERIITIVHDYIDKYMTSNIICSNDGRLACDAMILGSLIKSSTAIGIWPRPKTPYHDIKFKSLAFGVRTMQILDSCNQQGRYRHLDNNVHGIQQTINVSIKSLESVFHGFELDSFLRETQ